MDVEYEKREQEFLVSKHKETEELLCEQGLSPFVKITIELKKHMMYEKYFLFRLTICITLV